MAKSTYPEANDVRVLDHADGDTIMQKIEQARTQRLPDSRSWDLCLAFLEGRQYLTWDKLQNQFINLPQATGRSRIVINKMLNKYRNVASRLSTNYPSAAIIGATDSYDEVTKAEASELALKWYWADQRINYKCGELVRWLASTGNAAFHTLYDEASKKIVTKVISPYNLFWEPGANNPDEAAWAAIQSLVPRKELEATYPQFKNQLDEITAESQRDQKRPGGGFTQGGLQVPEDRLAFYEVCYKDGRCEFRVGPTLVLHEWTTPGNVFPLQFVRYTDLPGRLWGMGLIVQLLDLQSMYNRARNLVFDSGELMANPVWLVPKGAGVTSDGISNSPGKKIFYNPAAGEPKRVGGAELPQYFQNSIREIDQEMNDVAGTNDVQLGKRPVNFSSGTAIKEMTDNATSQLQLTQDNIEAAVAEMARVVLVYMQAYYTEGQFIKMLDINGRVVSRQLKSTDLLDMPNVHIEAGTLFRDEAEDRDNKTMGMLQAGLIDKDEARTRMSMHIGNRDAVKRMAAYAHAEDLLKAAMGAKDTFNPATGTMDVKGVEIWPTDDLDAIKDVFMEYVRSANYATLSEGRQQYIRDILMAVRNYGTNANDPNAADKANNEKVWPLQPKDPSQAAQMIAGSSTPLAGEQIAGEAEMMANRGANLSAVRQSIQPQGLPTPQGIPPQASAPIPQPEGV